MHFFLKIKHWQLFILLILSGAVPAFIGSFPDGLRSIIGILSVGIFFGWHYSMGVSLNKRISNEINLNVTYFKISFFLILFFYFGIALFKIVTGRPLYSHILILLPVILTQLYCLIYMLYFVAKSLKMAELKREVVYSDYADEFFLILFYPIGIWNIQPRINKLFENDLLDEPTS